MVTKGIWRMKLIQLNAWGGRLDRQITNFTRQEQPDILCLQEATSYPVEESGYFASIENIQASGELSYAALAPAFSFQYQRSTARFGNCILSKQPIQKSEIIFTHLEHKDNFEFGTDSANIRNFVHATIELNGQPCNVITHHGFWINEHKNGNEETFRQMRILGEYIDSLAGPVILTGDFNLAPHSESVELLNKRLKNLSIAHNLKTTRTPLTHKTEVCDYIFVNDAVKVKDFHASDELVSDHKALILEFDLAQDGDK
jgi:endonuclease/exonuclease/phosphatase family metal-dependent hydrolase